MSQSRAALEGFLILLSTLSLLANASAQYQGVKDIKDAMYKELKHTGGWYKNLNATSETGSQVPIAGDPVTGLLMNATHVQWPLSDRRILVCNLTNFEAVLKRLLVESASMANVVGMLVDPNGPLPTSMSSADTFPGAFNAPYPDTGYVWNPAGTGLARRMFPFPVIFMNKYLAEQVTGRAQFNQDQDFTGALYWADMTLDMMANSNSTYCLVTQRKCKPVGGFSVWAALPPLEPRYAVTGIADVQAGIGAIPVASTTPITLVTAQIDSNSYFHDYTQAADSPLSGLIAMLGAMDILRETGAAATYTRQLAFLALAGEPWDYMGSRRLLLEMYRNSTSTAGLDLALIDQVIEMGQVGRSFDVLSNSSTLYLHTQRSSGAKQYGDASLLVATLKQAAAMTNETKVTVNSASSINPGIPPSSLMSLLRHKPGIQGVVIADFDRQYVNTYYQSELDTGAFVDVQPMVGAAIVLARSLHALASPSGVPIAPLKVNTTAITQLVSNLAYCLMVDGSAPQYSLLCSTVQSFIKVGFTDQNAQEKIMPWPWRYVGLSAPDTPDPTNITSKREIFNFLFNIMANTTASVHSTQACDPFVNFCPAGMVCVGWKSGQEASTQSATMGRCKKATARFVPATSTRISWINVTTSPRMVLTKEETDFNDLYGWPIDPLWTESDWTSISPYVRVYMTEPRSTQVSVLVAGVLLTVATGLVSHYVQTIFEQRLKHE